jgi:anionic cell wall polymer biosynthesis LytR-Cps2A-Psr (LCP) family protein
MKNAATRFLVFLLAILLAAPLSGLAQQQAPAEAPSVLIIVSLDKTLPKSGKTYGMGYYLMTLKPEGRVLHYTSFPYNLSVELPGKKGPVNKQLQFACKELGPEGAAEVIRQNFGVTIDFWLLINMNALAELVDLAGGIEVFLDDLSINKKAGDLRNMVSKPWQKVQEAGLQKLSGVQMMAYISDTYYDKPTISQEEARFRERQEVLILGVNAGLKSNGIDGVGLLSAMFSGFGKNVMSNFTLKTLPELTLGGFTKCLENVPQFLHIPQTISTVKTDNGWESLGYTQEDAAAVRALTGQ